MKEDVEIIKVIQESIANTFSAIEPDCLELKNVQLVKNLDTFNQHEIKCSIRASGQFILDLDIGIEKSVIEPFFKYYVCTDPENFEVALSIVSETLNMCLGPALGQLNHLSKLKLGLPEFYEKKEFEENLESGFYCLHEYQFKEISFSILLTKKNNEA